MLVKRLETNKPLGSHRPKYTKVELSTEQRCEIITHHLKNKHLDLDLCKHFSECDSNEKTCEDLTDEDIINFFFKKSEEN